MGDTISTLLFRPPKPTAIDPNDYFLLDVDITSPLCINGDTDETNDLVHEEDDDDDGGGTTRKGSTNRYHLPNAATGCGMMCLDSTQDADLATLDRSFLLHNTDTICSVDPDYVCSSSARGSHSNGRQWGGRRSNGVGNNRVRYRIPAFFVRRRGAKHTLLFSHGNAEDLGMMYRRMKDLALVLSVNVMAYDYTGYGLSVVEMLAEDGSVSGSGIHTHDNSTNGNKSDGNGSGSPLDELNTPSENMTYRNIEAAYRYLTEERQIPPRNIILYGRSLGSGPSCYLAAKTALMGESVGGLILHSPFLSVYKVVADVWGMDVKGDMFNNEKRAANIRCPTLIIHGKLDEVVPFWHAPRLLNAISPEFRAPPLYVDGLGHNHIESRKRERYIKTITSFLEKYIENNGPVNDPLHPSAGMTNSIPLEERADPEGTKENTSFYINQAWIKHAKVMFAEVFSDNIICNSAFSVSDWSTRDASSGRRSRDRAGGISAERGGRCKEYDSKDKYACGHAYDDARDDSDEFAPWAMDRDGQQDRSTSSQNIANGSVTNHSSHNNFHSKMKRWNSVGLSRDSAMDLKVHQKHHERSSRYAQKSSSMPVICEKESTNGLKIKMIPARTRRNGGGRAGGIFAFRK